MSSNYDQIRFDNIREYGEGIRHLAILGRLYTERTHFILELLQNAEDANATKVRFRLYHDRLEVMHDGRPFDERDVRSICGVADSSKSGDLTKIGKFGIGFKSVYAYTNRPSIHSGGEHFCVEQYVRPHAEQALELPSGWTTLFTFPFDRSELPAEQAVEEIGNRLEALDVRTLLFLRRIESVEWDVEEGRQGIYLRQDTPMDPARKITVIGKGPEGEVEEEWLIFRRGVDGQDEGVGPVEVAFLLKSDTTSKTQEIVRATRDNLAVYFPTDIRTNLGFLIQGSYQTTTARDNLPHDSAWNRDLIRTTAALIPDALLAVRNLGLISVSMLQALPLDESSFPPEGLFRPLFEATRAALRDHALLPSDNGTLVSARHGRLARGAELTRVFSSEQMRAVLNLGANVRWLSAGISERGAHRLHIYLIEQRNYWFDASPGDTIPEDVYELRPRTLVRQLNEAFLTIQSDEWMKALYRFLRRQKDLSADLLDIPLIRLDDGAHVLMRGEGNAPTAYLAAPDAKAIPVDIPVVRRSITADSDARAFLAESGIPTYDVYSEVLDRVLPRYAPGEEISEAQHQEDIQLIISLLDDPSSNSRHHELEQRLKATPFLSATNATGDRTAYMQPSAVYLRTSELEVYFSGNSEAWFLNEQLEPQPKPEPNHFFSHFSQGDDKRRQAIKTAQGYGWVKVGVLTLPRLMWVKRELSWEQQKQLRIGATGNDSITSTTDILDYQIEGLETFLDGFSSETDGRGVGDASILWNLLLDRKRETWPYDSRGFGRGEYRWYYRTEHVALFEWATCVITLRNSAWIPDMAGKFQKPGDIGRSDLPIDFARDSTLMEVLGIGAMLAEQADNDVQAANLTGMDVDDIKAVRWLRENDPNMLDSIKQRRHESQRPGHVDEPTEILSRDMPRAKEATSNIDDSDDSDSDNFDYKEALRNRFTRQQPVSSPGSAQRPSPPGNPERSRDRVTREIKRGQQAEPPPTQRFEHVPRKIWEDKNWRVRPFLEVQYGGRCQICDFTFIKRDGKPYFEGMYLVHHTEARWIDRPGNVLCLCPNCCAMLQVGDSYAEDILEQILSYEPPESRNQQVAELPHINITVCGRHQAIQFTEPHMIDLQQLVQANDA